MRQVVLRQVIQHIALVFRLIQPATKLEAARSLVERPAGIMTGRHIVEAKLRAAALQSGELQISVAVDARIRRATAQVRIAEPVDHLAAERSREVEREVLEPQPERHLTGVLHIALAAAGALAHHARSPGAGNLVVEQLHGDARCIIARIAKQQRCNGAVHPAAHRNQHTLSHFTIHLVLLLQTTCHREAPCHTMVEASVVLVGEAARKRTQIFAQRSNKPLAQEPNGQARSQASQIPLRCRKAALQPIKIGGKTRPRAVLRRMRILEQNSARKLIVGLPRKPRRAHDPERLEHPSSDHQARYSQRT